jgi:hypothetical protein
MTYNSKNNYCSYSPDRLFGITFNFACYLHDRQYRNEVVRRETRLKADQNLRDRIYSEFVKKNKKIKGYIISRIYYFAVRLLGFFAWENHTPQ